MKKMKKTALAATVLMSVMAGSAWAETVNVTADTENELEAALRNPNCDVITIDAGRKGRKVGDTVYNTALQLPSGTFEMTGPKTIQGNGYLLSRYEDPSVKFVGSGKELKDNLVFDNVAFYYSRGQAGSATPEWTFQNITVQNFDNSSLSDKNFYVKVSSTGYDYFKTVGDFSAITIYSGLSFKGQDILFKDNTKTGFVGGAAMLVRNSTLSLEDCVFDGNKASMAYGGAVYLTNATVTKLTGTFKNNVEGNEGGAIGIQDGSQVNGLGGEFLNNSAKNNGGAIVVGTNNSGAGSSDIRVKVTLAENTVFKGNKVTTTTGNTTKLDGAGGAIFSCGEVIINKAIFGGFGAGEGNEAQYGGAVANTATKNSPTYLGKMQIADSEFICNLAGAGGAVYNTSYASSSGGDSAHNNWSYAKPEVTISGTTFMGNKADKTRDDKYNDNKGFANYYSGNQVDRQGGGGAVYNDATMTITNSVFGGLEEGQGNKADNGGAIFNVGFAPSNGTPIRIMYYELGTMTITDSSFIGNSALMNGGAIFNGANMTLGTDKQTVINFTSNSADKGGAIFNGFSTYNNEVSVAANGNRAKGIHNEVSTLSISNASFTNNTATTDGGAIYNEAGCSLTLENVTFSGNTAAGKPNDIYNAGTITFKGTKNELGDGLMVAATGSSTIVDSGAVLNLAGGKYSAEDIAKFTVNGTLNLTKSGIYSAKTETIFSNGIIVGDYDGSDDKEKKKAFVDANKNNPTAVKDGLTDSIKLNLVGGSLEFSDSYYTADYAKAAKTALAGFKYNGNDLSQTALVFTGKIVSAVEIAPETKADVLLDEIVEEPAEPGKPPAPPVEYDKVVAGTLNGSLFVGDDILNKGGAAEKIAEETKKGEGDKGIDVKDTSKSSISVGALDLAGGATGLVIANDRGVTVGGSEGNDKEVNLIKVNGDDTKPVNVVVGLSKDTAEVLGVDQKGTFNIGNSQAGKDAKYKLNGDLTVNEGSRVEVKGQTKVTGTILLNDAMLDVKEGSKVEVPALEVASSNGDDKSAKIIGNLDVKKADGEGEVKLKKNAVLEVGGENKGEEAVLVTDKFHLDDSKLHVGQVANVQANVVTVDSTDTAADSAKNSTLSGKVKANALVVKKAKTSAENKMVVLNVGNKDKKANVEVKDTKLQDNMLFLDPAWLNGVGLEGASHYATDTTNLDGAYVVGRNSILTFGATNAEVDALFGSTGLKWGENEISAAAYVAKNIDVTNGSLVVKGSLEQAPAMENKGTVKFADKSLFMVNGNNCLSNAAVTGVKSVEIANGAKLYINGAEAGTYKVLGIDSGAVTVNIDGWQTSGNVLANSFVAFDSAEYKDSFVFVTLKQADVDLSDTVVSNVGERMIKSPTGSLVRETMKAMLSDLYTEVQKAANVNTYANLGENLGVTRGAYDVANMVGNAVTEHWDNNAKGENVWAVYTHSKDKVDGLKLGGMDAQYDAQYNGVTVGYDINKDFGIALNHVDGNVTNGFGGHNDAKYYGVSVYGRKNFGKVSLLGDVTYSHGKNELAQNGIEADAKTNIFSMGVIAKYATNIVKVGNVTPFAGVRYVRIDGKDYTDSLGVNREADKVNSVIVPMGVEYSGEFNVSGSDWNCKPVLAVGYLFNFGDKDNTMTLGYNGAKDSFGYDFVDNGAFFTKAALNFTKNNLTLGVGYDYMKSSNSNNNRWNVNLSYTF